MKISILGTGMVGQTIAQRMRELGHEVYMGSRNAQATKARKEPNPMTGVAFADWYKEHQDVQVINFEALPADTSLFINATNGAGSIEALKTVGVDKLKGKTVLDIANPLDFSQGTPPSLYVCNTDSLGEQIQREFPKARIVKGLNTMNCYLMMNPALIPGDHNVFISGNEATAKQEVKNLLQSIGWKEENILELGDITTARGTEMLLPVWLRLWGALGTPEFNFHITKK